MNPAIRMVVHNYAWEGYPSAFFSEHVPTVVVGQKQAELFDADPQNLDYMKWSVVANRLDDAMHFAYKVAKTDNVIIFDGAMGGINVSESLAELLVRRAPEVSARVDTELMPRWLSSAASKRSSANWSPQGSGFAPLRAKKRVAGFRLKGMIVQTAVGVQQDIREIILPKSMAGSSAPGLSPRETEL